jgi:hypothetical protein
MIQTLWTLDITPLQRGIRFQILSLSSLFPSISILTLPRALWRLQARLTSPL